MDLPSGGVVARSRLPLPLHLPPRPQVYQCPGYGLRGKTRVWKPGRRERTPPGAGCPGAVPGLSAVLVGRKRRRVVVDSGSGGEAVEAEEAAGRRRKAVELGRLGVVGGRKGG